MKKKIMLCLLAVAVITAPSCKKPEKGETGPAGPAGNANVKSQTFSTSAWTLNSSNEYETIISVPAITQEILDKGTVQVFLKESTTYVQLPVSYADEEWTAWFYLGNVHIIVGDASGATISNPGACTFKVVTIAGTKKKTDQI